MAHKRHQVAGIDFETCGMDGTSVPMIIDYDGRIKEMPDPTPEDIERIDRFMKQLRKRYGITVDIGI